MIKHFDISSIRLNDWRNADRKGAVNYYDDAVDAMLLFIKQPVGRYVAFRIDDAVSLIYTSSTKELLGIRIESFYKSFTRNLRLRERIWRLSDSNYFLEESRDLIFTLYQDNDFVRVEGNLVEAYMVEGSSSKILFGQIPVPS